MLHLLPFKILSFVLIAGLISLVMLLLHLGIYGNNTVDDFVSIMKMVSYGSAVISLAAYLIWRWVPQVQVAIFPYLGGTWKGSLMFDGFNGQGIGALRCNVLRRDGCLWSCKG